jgi:hypothetical protein
VEALQRKRSEIASIIADIEKQLAGLRIDLDSIDRALAIIRESPTRGEVTAVNRASLRLSEFLKRGEVRQRILEELRNKQTVSATELAEATMSEKGLDDRAMRAAIIRTYLVRLYYMRDQGRVEQVGRNRNVRWRLAD